MFDAANFMGWAEDLTLWQKELQNKEIKESKKKKKKREKN